MGEMVFHPKKSGGWDSGFQKSQVYPYMANSAKRTGFCCQVPPNPAYGCKAIGLKFSVFRTAYAARATGALLSFATSFN